MAQLRVAKSKAQKHNEVCIKMYRDKARLEAEGYAPTQIVEAFCRRYKMQRSGVYRRLRLGGRLLQLEQ